MKRQATADAIGLHERASATPTRARVAVPEARRKTAPAPAEKLSLRAHQQWFYDVVTTPESEPAPIDENAAERLVLPSPSLTAFERLEIYRRSYHARLIECLADDYPALQFALGETEFETLCRRYVARHPPTDASLNVYGRNMAEFCVEQPPPSIPVQFASDLATLEWAIVQSIHAATATPLGPDDLARVRPEQWPDVRLVANPSLRILHTAYPVNAYFQGFRSGATPAIPAEQPIAVAVFRTGLSVWRMELSPPMVALFQSLANGLTLSAALGEVEPLLAGIPQAADQVMIWFRDGVSSGLFVALELG